MSQTPLPRVRLQPPQVTPRVGPSGCGKGTFQRPINRLNDLIPGCRVTGQIIVGQQDINHSRVYLVSLRRQVGLVFQRPNPFPKSSYDNARVSGYTAFLYMGSLIEYTMPATMLTAPKQKQTEDYNTGRFG